jgi:molybdenum cofactor biosynthesis enzyme MoaA
MSAALRHCYARGGESNMSEMSAVRPQYFRRGTKVALCRGGGTGGEPLVHTEIDAMLEGIRQIALKGLRMICAVDGLSHIQSV